MLIDFYFEFFFRLFSVFGEVWAVASPGFGVGGWN